MDVGRGAASYEFVTRRGSFSSHALTGAELAGSVRRLTGCSIGSSAASSPATSTTSPSVCRFCDYKGVCDVRRGAVAKRKAADPRRASFEEMKQIT